MMIEKFKKEINFYVFFSISKLYIRDFIVRNWSCNTEKDWTKIWNSFCDDSTFFWGSTNCRGSYLAIISVWCPTTQCNNDVSFFPLFACVVANFCAVLNIVVRNRTMAQENNIYISTHRYRSRIIPLIFYPKISRYYENCW